MSDGHRPRCAAQSRLAGEPIIGTASRVRRWFVVEQPGPWGRHAPVDSKMDELVARSLESTAKRHGVRMLLIRRPGWADDDRPTRAAFLAHTTRDSTWLERLPFTDPRDLRRLDLGVVERDAPPGIGEPAPAEVVLVCTNGRHDACCADRGRPVVRALHDAGVADVWETTHIGGDRFAANILALPSGVYLGRVEADEAARVVAEVRAGLVPLEHYRGRSCFPPLVQAAETFVRRELDERRLEAVRVIRGRRLAGDTLAVRLAVAGAGEFEAVVRQELGEETFLTCTAVGRSRPWRYELVSLDAVGA